MFKLIDRLKGEGGYTIIEGIVVTSVFAIIIGAAISLTQLAYFMDRQAQDGYEAQNEGRRVLSEMVKYLRPAEKLNADIPIVYATNNGTVIDMRIDTDKDLTPEIGRLELDQVNKEIVLWLDEPDDDGMYYYESEGANYLATYGSGTAADPTKTDVGEDPGFTWNERRVIARRVVNEDPDGTWDAQTPNTQPEKDFRLFTYYAEDFDSPLNSATENWNNDIRGVKIYVWSDVQPAEIPTPFGIETNVHLRNVQGQ